MGSYGYVSSSNEITWTSGSSVTLVKENYGNLDQNDGMSYSSSRLARVSNGGEVFYRLTVRKCPGKRGENYTRLAVMDALPATGDITLSGLSRLSDWPVYLKSIDSVTVDGKGVKLYCLLLSGNCNRSYLSSCQPDPERNRTKWMEQYGTCRYERCNGIYHCGRSSDRAGVWQEFNCNVYGRCGYV